MVLSKGYSSEEVYQDSECLQNIWGVEVNVFRHLTSALVRSGNVGMFWSLCVPGNMKCCC